MAAIKKLLENPAKIICVLDKWNLSKLIPDKMYLKLQYRATMGKKLDLKDPKSINEKLQWMKLYDRKPEYTTMVDKYAVKSYVAERIGQEYIIPTLGVWDRVEDIDFDALPNQFVLKCTHDSGGLVVCRDKAKLNIEEAKNKLRKSLNNNFYYDYREWPYKNVHRRIMAEKYMEEKPSADATVPHGLTDYKFYCFNGEPGLVLVTKGLEDHATAAISFLSTDWQFAPYYRSDYKPFSELPPKPQKLDHMLELARKLSANHDFLRVDLYEIDGKVYFSELTFFPGAGIMPFADYKYDLQIGNMLQLTKNKRTNKQAR